MSAIRYACIAPLLVALAGAPAVARSENCIGVVHAGGGYAFWTEVGRGAKQAGERLGVNIYFRGPPDENSPDAQQKIIQAVERQRCTALVLAPDAPQRAADVARLGKAGVPTVYIDRDYGDGEAVAVVATDNYRAGRLAGQQLAEALGNRGEVAVLRMKAGVRSTDERERGFIDAARAAGLTIVAEEWIGSAVGEARGNALKVLTRLRRPVDGLFTPNESTTRATLVALKEAGLVGKSRLVGFDMSREFIDALRDHTLYGAVVQQPFEMGYQGVMIAHQAAQGRAPGQSRVDSGAFFVTAAALASPAIACALAPYLPESERPAACRAAPRER